MANNSSTTKLLMKVVINTFGSCSCCMIVINTSFDCLVTIFAANTAS